MASLQSPDHPIVPLILQRFFSLYFAQPEAQDVGTNGGWAVGQRIMTNSAALSALLKRLALGWVDAAKRLEEQNSVSFPESVKKEDQVIQWVD